MKRKIFMCAVLALVLMTSYSVIAVNPDAAGSTQPSSSQNGGADETAVLKARFLNMLNHNFAYNEAFNSVEELANCSVLALFDLRDSGDEAFIAETYVETYLYNMNGVETDGLSDINEGFPHKDGYVYIIPRGFSIYRHSIDSVTLNEDGSYTVITSVEINSHDGGETVKAKTLFIKNSDSDFGYNIVSSDIITGLSDI